jgi:sulfur dioxygenase
MWFRMLHNEGSGELSYLLADADAGEAVLVDPRGSDLAVWRAVMTERGLWLRWVLRTHHHDPAQGGDMALLLSLGAPIVQGDTPAGGPVPAGRHVVSDGESLPFGDELVRVLKTPGHTANCLSFVWRDRVFCGGLLAADACPAQPFPADAAALWDSVSQRIFTLPDETLLFAGHAQRARAVSTVLEQRRWHPLLAGLSRDEFLARAAKLVPQRPFQPSEESFAS